MYTTVEEEQLVEEVCTIKLRTDSDNVLHIEAIGMAASRAWQQAELNIQKTNREPSDGIYDFEFVVSQANQDPETGLQKMHTHYQWHNFPEQLRGIRVVGKRNSILVML